MVLLCRTSHRYVFSSIRCSGGYIGGGPGAVLAIWILLGLHVTHPSYDMEFTNSALGIYLLSGTRWTGRGMIAGDMIPSEAKLDRCMHAPVDLDSMRSLPSSSHAVAPRCSACNE